MAHHIDKEGFPAIPLAPGMKLVLEARDPTTEAAVTGVTSSLWAVYGFDKSSGVLLEDPIPEWVPEDAEGVV